MFDLDPGNPATTIECCKIALELRSVLQLLGLKCWAMTSGAKAIQVYVPINQPHGHAEGANFALVVGHLLAKRLPSLVLFETNKAPTSGKVFIDWSQNSFHKTTIAPYSLRWGFTPIVSTPLTWEEVSAGSNWSSLRMKFWSELYM